MRIKWHFNWGFSWMWLSRWCKFLPIPTWIWTHSIDIVLSLLIPFPSPINPSIHSLGKTISLLLPSQNKLSVFFVVSLVGFCFVCFILAVYVQYGLSWRLISHLTSLSLGLHLSLPFPMHYTLTPKSSLSGIGKNTQEKCWFQCLLTREFKPFGYFRILKNFLPSCKFIWHLKRYFETQQ